MFSCLVEKNHLQGKFNSIKEVNRVPNVMYLLPDVKLEHVH